MMMKRHVAAITVWSFPIALVALMALIAVMALMALVALMTLMALMALVALVALVALMALVALIALVATGTWVCSPQGRVFSRSTQNFLPKILQIQTCEIVNNVFLCVKSHHSKFVEFSPSQCQSCTTLFGPHMH